MDPETLKGMTLIELKKKALGQGVSWVTVYELDDKEDPKQSAIELMLAKAKEIDVETLKGMSWFDLKKTALRNGVPLDKLDDMRKEEDPEQATIELILSVAQNDLETLKGMTLKDLKKKALDKGVPRDTVDELDGKQDPKQAAIELILPTVDVAMPDANSSLRRQAVLAGAIQQEVDDALDQPNMRRALIALIRSKQDDLMYPVGFVDPVGCWEYQGDAHQFVRYTRDESLQLDTARNRRVSEFDMVVGRSKLQIRINFHVDEGGSIKAGTQTSLTSKRIRKIRREASAWELVQTARRVMEECLQDPPDVGVAKYTKPDSILQILRHEKEPVKLLRRSFVTTYTGKEGQSAGLPRRQDLEQGCPTVLARFVSTCCGKWQNGKCPTEAFLRPEEVVMNAKESILNIFSISYCWRAWDHPDADGRQLRAIESKIKKQKHMERFRSAESKDAGIFWDFCSLHQKDKDGHRTKKEWIQFNEALSTMDIWYMHAMIITFIVNGKWTRELGINYEDRGWTHFERSCAELIKPAIIDDGTGYGLPRIIEFEQSGRKLPLPPELFAEQLGKRRFTSRGDKENVVVLYTKACMLALRETRTIDLFGIRFQHHDGKQVASVLQHCLSASTLLLSKMGMDDAGAVAIAETLPMMQNLKTLHLWNNEIGDDGAKAIAEVLPRMSNLSELDLENNRLTEVGRTALRQSWGNCGKRGRLNI